MKFDRMGRREEYIETVCCDGLVITNVRHRFVYDGDYCIRRLDALAYNLIDLVFAWDRTETISARPLMIEKPGTCMLHVTHDGNKNVSDLVCFSGETGVTAHYDYAPFGALIATTHNPSSTDSDFRTYNPFRFSSEYADDTLGLVYYNYRHYEPIMGRWLSKDPIEELGGLNLYESAVNDPITKEDRKGLYVPGFPTVHSRCNDVIDNLKQDKDGAYVKYQKLLDKRAEYLRKNGKDSSPCVVDIKCDCCRGIQHLHDGGTYTSPRKGESSGSLVICENALWNINDNNTYKAEAKQILEHEMLHAVQACYSEKFETPCEESICREINSYYNANTLDSSLYRTESERRDRVWEGVLYSSSFTCFPSKAPKKLSEQDEKQIKRIFDRLYEKCKNKWPRKSL